MAERFYIENFGCRATWADAAAIERSLADRGLERSDSAADAGVVVVNTCTVTASADAQARQAIRRYHRTNPQARIVVTGCYAQRAPEELAGIEGVTWVVGNSHQTEIARLLDVPARETGFVPLAALETETMSLARGPAKILTGDIFAHGTVQLGPADAGHRTRPVLKIQDGCNNRCAYCVIPFVRGRSRSLPPETVVAEIRRLAAAGYKEMVLSGINLGSYGRDLTPRVELLDLLRRILDETDLARLRLSSIEPMDLTQELVELVAESGRIAQHFHVPLQSGSDRVLAAMHRWYRAAHYAQRIERVRERLPAAGIGADVIAGFPGETEADHAETMRLIERLPFTYLHVFAFSARPGTAAASLPGQVPPQVIQRRSRELRALAAGKSAAFRAAHAGRTLRVLTLDRTGGENGSAWTEALSDNYLQVRVAGRWPPNEMLDVILGTAESAQSLVAKPLAKVKE